MRKEFLINSGLLLLLNVLIKPLYVLGIELKVQNVVGVESYGLYFTLIAFIYFFQFINEFGFTQFLRKHLSETRGEITKSFPILIAIKLLLSTIFILIVLLFNYFFSYEEQNVQLLFFISISFVLSSLIQAYRSGLSGLGHYRWDSLLSVMDKFLLVVFCSLFLFSSLIKYFDIYTFVYCQLGSLIITLAYGMFTFYKLTPMTIFIFDRDQMFGFLKKASPYALIILVMSVYSRLDAVMLREMLDNGFYYAGSYAAGYRLFDAANMFAFMIGALLLPMISYMINQNEPLSELINLAVRLMTLLTFTTAVITCFYSDQIMEFLYVDYKSEWGDILFWLILGFIPLGLGHVFGVLMLGNNQVHTMNKIYFAALILNLVLNLILIPRQQAIGAAIATFLTQLLVILCQIIAFGRSYPWTLDKAWQIISFILGSILAVYLISIQEQFSWVIGIIVSGVLVIFWALCCNMLPIKELSKYRSLNLKS